MKNIKSVSEMIIISFLLGILSGFAICSLCVSAKKGSSFEVELGDYESHKEFLKKNGFDE